MKRDSTPSASRSVSTNVSTFVTGVVLAGGAGRRLGRDKTILQLPGMTEDFLGRAVRVLRVVVSDVRVSCQSNSPDSPNVADSPNSAVMRARLDKESIPIIPDLYPGEGTLRAVYSALRQVGRPCLCIPCDMPFLTVDVLAQLLAARENHRGDALLTAWRQADTGYVESLAAVYEPESLPFFEAALKRGEYQLNRVIPQNRWHCLDFQRDQAAPFWNVNHPEDWDKALLQAVELSAD